MAKQLVPLSDRSSAFFLLASALLIGTFVPIADIIIMLDESAVAIKKVYAQTDDLWYVGEGVKQGMWVKYRIEELDTNNGRPYEMTIHFREQQQDGEWIAPVYVVFQGKVLQGTLRLGNNLAALGGSDIPEAMEPFIDGYRGSIQWLESFTQQSSPLSLRQPSWGKIAAIGGEEVRPLGEEQVTVAGGTFDATVIGWHRGQVDNRIWIVNEFPYPVRAETYADITTGQPPILFRFELLDTGTGQPPVPEGEAFVPTPPLSQTTGRGTYIVKLDWSPEAIEPGQQVTFEVTFEDNTGFPLNRVNYDLIVQNANGSTIEEFTVQNTDATGTGTHQIIFENAGSISVAVVINTVEGRQPGGGQFIERADFNVVAVPEFPMGGITTTTIISATAIGLVVIVLRLKANRNAQGYPVM